jgi:tetratricopeptide (TPR) repeat protein
MNDVVPLLKHTPSAQRPEILEAITVQREPLVAALVESALDTDNGLRHHLLVGPRGIGKTHILSLVASRVRAADPDARRVVVAWLDEDPWAVRTYGKFLAAIGLRLAGALDDPELAKAAEGLRASSAEDDGVHGEALLRGALGKQRLVLLVENLNEVFRRIGRDGQLRFRAFAEDWGQMLLFATTPQLFDGVRQHASPFYGFFAVTHLDELSLDSAADLLRRIAELRRDTKLRRFLDTDVAQRRLRAIEALAGGHPRVWLLLAGCISVPAIDKLVPLFLEALDDLTPYYQDRLRALSDPQQEIVALLSEAGGALSNRELSERSGIPERQVATIMRQLSDRGYVRRASLPEDLSVGDRRMSFWELREPLMRLCLDVKQARGEPLRIIVEFLRAWYGSRLLDELNQLPPMAELANVYASEAFRTLTTLSGEELMRGTPDEIMARVERGLVLQPDSVPLHIAKAGALAMLGHNAEACKLLEPLVANTSVTIGSVAMRLQLARLQRASNQSPDVESLLEATAELTRMQPDSPQACGLAGMAYNLAGRDDEAVAAFERALELNGEEFVFADGLGVVLSRLGRHEEAADAFARATAIAPDEPTLHDHLGTALSRLERNDEALEAFSRAVEISPDVASYHYCRGLVLEALERHEEAFEEFLCAAELEPDSRHQGARALALLQLGRVEEALDAVRSALDLDPNAAYLHLLRGMALDRAGHEEAAIEAYARASALDPDDPDYCVFSARLLRRLGRFREAAQAAESAVALDSNSLGYRVLLVDAVLASGDVGRALALLDEALERWEPGSETPPGEAQLICETLWQHYRNDPRRQPLVERLVATYRGVRAMDDLDRGLVAIIPQLLDDEASQAEVDAWVADWVDAPFPEGDIALQMLQAARAWKLDRDQTHLLALPPEQREILIRLLPG